MNQLLKIVILGSSGMAGHIAYLYLSKYYEVIGIDCVRSNFTDILCSINDDDICSVISSLNPNVVINCTGIFGQGTNYDNTLVDFINSKLTHRLDLLLPNSIRIVHLSTDYVFSGLTGPYSVSDTPSATSDYGVSKIKAELTSSRFICIRMSIIGPSLDISKNSFFNSVYINKQVNGFINAKTTLITTLELAKFIHRLLVDDVKSGLFQYPCKNVLSKYYVLKSISSVFHTNCIIKKTVKDVSTNHALVKNIKYENHSFKSQLIELRDFMKLHDDVYSNYLVTYEH